MNVTVILFFRPLKEAYDFVIGISSVFTVYVLRLTFYPTLEISCFAFSLSFICHQQISCNLSCVSSFDYKCIKRTAKLPLSGAFSQSIASLLLGMSSVWPNTSNKLITFPIGLDVLMSTDVRRTLHFPIHLSMDVWVVCNLGCDE